MLAQVLGRILEAGKKMWGTGACTGTIILLVQVLGGFLEACKKMWGTGAYTGADNGVGTGAGRDPGSRQDVWCTCL